MFLMVLKVTYLQPISTPRGSRINVTELSEVFIDDIRNSEKNMTNDIFREHFWYQSPAFLAEDLLKAQS